MQRSFLDEFHNEHTHPVKTSQERRSADAVTSIESRAEVARSCVHAALPSCEKINHIERQLHRLIFETCRQLMAKIGRDGDWRSFLEPLSKEIASIVAEWECLSLFREIDIELKVESCWHKIECPAGMDPVSQAINLADKLPLISSNGSRESKNLIRVLSFLFHLDEILGGGELYLPANTTNEERLGLAKSSLNDAINTAEARGYLTKLQEAQRKRARRFELNREALLRDFVPREEDRRS